MVYLKYFFPILLFSVVLLNCWSCETENFDYLTEEELPTDSTVIEENTYFNYRIGSAASTNPQAFAKIIDEGLVVISSESITCLPDTGSGFGWSIDYRGQLPSFDLHLAYTKRTDGSFDVFPISSVLRTIIGRDTVGGFDFQPILNGCSDFEPIFSITTQTTDYIEGIYEAEFFKIIPTGNIDDCTLWESIGVMKLEFAVELEDC